MRIGFVTETNLAPRVGAIVPMAVALESVAELRTRPINSDYLRLECSLESFPRSVPFGVQALTTAQEAQLAIQFISGGTGDVVVDWKQFNAYPASDSASTGGTSEIVIGDTDW